MMAEAVNRAVRTALRERDGAEGDRDEGSREEIDPVGSVPQNTGHQQRYRPAVGPWPSRPSTCGRPC